MSLHVLVLTTSVCLDIIICADSTLGSVPQLGHASKFERREMQREGQDCLDLTTSDRVT
jgi:hypothetical protein